MAAAGAASFNVDLFANAKRERMVCVFYGCLYFVLRAP
jgi:hypothetical protein